MEENIFHCTRIGDQGALWYIMNKYVVVTHHTPSFLLESLVLMFFKHKVGVLLNNLSYLIFKGNKDKPYNLWLIKGN